MAVGSAAVSNGPLTQLNNLIRQMASQGNNRRNQAITQSEMIEGAARYRVQSELQGVSGGVKAHENAHMAILGGAAASGIQYTYARGPGGTRYAVGGSIKIDFQPVPGNPQATLDKARRIRMAALAPGSPSAADLRVAARAYRLEQQAQEKLEEEKQETQAAEQGEILGRDNRSDRAGSINEQGMPWPDQQSGYREPVNILA